MYFFNSSAITKRVAQINQSLPSAIRREIFIVTPALFLFGPVLTINISCLRHFGNFRMHNPAQITVRVLKYDGAEYRRWNATLSRRTGSLIVLAAAFADDVQHDLLGNISCGTRTIEYYWLDRW